MKNAYLLIALLIFSFQFASAQNFAPVGAKWYYTQYSATGPEIGYTYLESLKDTVFNGVECREIGGSPSMCAWSAHYMYDSNDSVFFWHPERDEFCLLYNFGAQVGDTWTVYHISSDFGSGQIDSSIVHVDSIETEIIDGQVLRTLDISQLNPTQDYWVAGGRIVERIGNMGYLFPSYGACDPVPGNLRCYQDSVINFHQGSYECDEVISSIVESDEVVLSVYPNPTDGLIVIDLLPRMKDLIFRVLDMSGRLVLEKRLNNMNDRIQCDLTALNAGIYFAEVQTENNTYVTKICLEK